MCHKNRQIACVKHKKILSTTICCQCVGYFLSLSMSSASSNPELSPFSRPKSRTVLMLWNLMNFIRNDLWWWWWIFMKFCEDEIHEKRVCWTQYYEKMSYISHKVQLYFCLGGPFHNLQVQKKAKITQNYWLTIAVLSVLSRYRWLSPDSIMISNTYIFRSNLLLVSHLKDILQPQITNLSGKRHCVVLIISLFSIC